MHRIELRHLRYFIALAEELHLGRAAERLHIEPSPLSRSITALEEAIQVRLLDRSPRGTQLTEVGQVFFEEAKRVTQTLSSAVELARQTETMRRRTLRVASCCCLDTQLSSLLARSRAVEPEVLIQLTHASISEIRVGLRSGLFDIGFAFDGDVEPHFQAVPVWRSALMALVPERHPMLMHRNVPVQALARQPLIVQEGCRKFVDELFEEHDASPEIHQYLRSMEAMVALVAAGYGVGCAAWGQVLGRGIPGVVVRNIDSELANFTTYVLRRADNTSDHVMRFWQRAQEATPALNNVGR